MSENIKNDNPGIEDQRLLMALGNYIGTPEKFKSALDTSLKKLDRKEFMKAVKNGDSYFVIDPESNRAIPHKITDSRKGAIGWLRWFELYIFYVELEHGKMNEETKNDLWSYLEREVDKKSLEIFRSHKKKPYEVLRGNRVPMFGSKLNRDIASIIPNDYFTEDSLGNLLGRYKGMDITAKTKNGATVPIDASIAMVYWIIQSKFAAQISSGFIDLDNPKNRTIDLSIEEYKDLRGLSSTSSARKNLDKAAQAFVSFRTSFRDILDGEEGELLKYTGISIADNAVLDKGALHIELTKGIAELIKNGAVLNMPKKIFKINMQKNPNAFYIAKKLIFHQEYNSQKKSKGANPNRISVSILIDECRTIPKYEDIKASGNIYSRIISPFISALESIELTENNNLNGFISYRFIHENGEKLLPEEQTAIDEGKISYTDFRNLYIDFKVISA